jgi:hypothetical protein
MNNFIVSGKGFLKSTEFNKDTKLVDIEWTHVLREAQKFHSKSAVNLINKHNIEAFVWNPYKEEPIRGKWEVTQRREHYSFIHDENHKALEWKPEKVIMEKKTDVNFLTSKGVERKVYYDSYEEALEICQERNRQIIIELEGKMQKMVKA